MTKKENLEGKVFTRWTVIKDEGGPKVFCRCSCGTERWVDKGNLRGGGSTSCGCLKKEQMHEKFTKDLTGRVFGRLTVVSLAGRDKNQKLLWNTICECGSTKVVRGEQLVRGQTSSCGCLQKELTTKRCTKPMIGKVFGRLTVLEKMYTKKGRGAYYKCICECGNIVIVQGTMLRSKNTTSCGCYNKERTRERCFKDLTGQRFGKLVVQSRADDLIQENGRKRVRFLCKCDCGGTIIPTRDTLVAGEVMSCGCIQSKGEYLISQILLNNNINFEKQFIVVPRNEYNSRIESLLKLCGLMDRQVSSFDDAKTMSDRQIEYQSVKVVLEEERKVANQFIDKVLQRETDEDRL